MKITCPKCGCIEVEINYRYRTENLECHCSRCRYQWNVDALDKADQEQNELSKAKK